MIDTIKFQVCVNEATFSEIRSKSIEHMRIDRPNKRHDMKYMQADIHIPSHDYHITLKAFDEIGQRISFECSLPKVYFGENVTLLYPGQLIPALESLWTSIKSIYPCFPHYELWAIKRLDLCYAWKLQNQLYAQEILDALKLLDFPRKHKYIYKTALMFRGRHYTLKFYLKETEFMRHDYKRLIKQGDIEFADRTAELSKCVLRFEITIRNEQLMHWFKKSNIYYTDLSDTKFLQNLLHDCVQKVLKNRSPESMTDALVESRLKTKWGNTKGARLFAFYNTYYSDSPHKKTILESGYSSSTIWRKRRDIADAGVGIGSESLGFEFNISIPSELVVNPDPIPKV